MSNLLPLEGWLKRQCKTAGAKGTKISPEGHNLFTLYELQKGEFEAHVYNHVNSGLVTLSKAPASKSPTGKVTIYTDHGVGHVNSLIKAIGSFVGCHTDKSKLYLNTYEVYLLLMSALSHDAGNIFGREDYELRVVGMLNNPQLRVLSDNFEIRAINDIASAHTGKGLVSGGLPKDTLSNLTEEGSADMGIITYNPRQLAAILRFCDELCEDNKRIPKLLLGRPEVANGPSSKHLFYGESISSVSISHTRGCIQINYEVSEEQIIKKIQAEDVNGRSNSYYLVDEILFRLAKIKREMTYCFRYVDDARRYKNVSARIECYRTGELDERIYYPHPLALLDLTDKEYPSDSLPSDFLGEYNGAKLRQRILQERRQRSTK